MLTSGKAEPAHSSLQHVSDENSFAEVAHWCSACQHGRLAPYLNAQRSSLLSGDCPQGMRAQLQYRPVHATRLLRLERVP